MKEMEKMQSSRLTQALLLVVIVIQLWFLARPTISPAPVNAASLPVQYKVANVWNGNYVVSPDAIEQSLNQIGKDGWTLVVCPSVGQCIFKK
jgi:hypothetical protein